MVLHVHIHKNVDDETEAKEEYLAIVRDLAGHENLSIEGHSFTNDLIGKTTTEGEHV